MLGIDMFRGLFGTDNHYEPGRMIRVSNPKKKHKANPEKKKRRKMVQSSRMKNR